MKRLALTIVGLPLAALLAFAGPGRAESELDPIDTLEDAQETYQELTEVLSKVEDAQEALAVLAQMDAARILWQLNPEDLNAGIDWANKTAKGFSEIKKLIPSGLPGPVEEMIGGYLSAVPVYVDALTGQLRKEVARIDKAAADASGSVEYGNAGCENGPITKTGVRIIKRLDVPEYEKQDIFKRACQVGLRGALADHDLL